THTASGEEVAWETIKQKLLEIIDKEPKSNPLSDEDLVTKLNEAGYPVARRTVTKYRKILKIPSSRQRKDWTAVKDEKEETPAETLGVAVVGSDGAHSNGAERDNGSSSEEPVGVPTSVSDTEEPQ